nr:hypothetical protein [Ishige okamurae]
MDIETDLITLIHIFPNHIVKRLKDSLRKDHLVEIVLDLGRRPEARFSRSNQYISHNLVSWQDLDYITKRIGKFNNENRAGVEETLHRISCIRNQQGIIVGLTCRVGRNLIGTIAIIRDLLEKDNSLLLLGKPGVGKTTTIREISRVLADERGKRVVVIDGSNEIAGNSDVVHSSIGKARRMQVSSLCNQHDIMIEAVENHMPEVIIVDEIGTKLDAVAAKTIAERGVQLIGTAHGSNLENLVKNPTLVDLIGGIENVTLSDEEAKRRKKKKSTPERKTLPTFQIAIEITCKTCWVIHQDLATAIDRVLLVGHLCGSEYRFLRSNVSTTKQNWYIHSPNSIHKFPAQFDFFSKQRVFLHIRQMHSNKEKRLINLKLKKRLEFKICTYKISKAKIKKITKSLQLYVHFTNDVNSADMIITLNTFMKKNLRLRELHKIKHLLIYGIEENTTKSIENGLYNLFS